MAHFVVVQQYEVLRVRRSRNPPKKPHLEARLCLAKKSYPVSQRVDMVVWQKAQGMDVH
jgi:hypothetical protein